MTTFTAHQTTAPPTAVTHCVAASFTSAQARNLVLVRSSYLEVYECFPTRPMRLVFRSSLFAVIQSVHAVRLAHRPADVLVLCFEDANLSIVEWDPDALALRTLPPLKSFDEHRHKEDFVDYPPPVLRVDPQGRCAIMLFFGTKLAVLPFRQAATLLDEDMGDGEDEKACIVNDYVVDLAAELGVHRVIDVAFLHGYYEPTFFVLYQLQPTWGGRLAAKANTVSGLAVSINMSQRQLPQIWAIDRLPHDSHKVIPVPDPIGGVLVISNNILIYAKMTDRYFLALNGHARTFYGAAHMLQHNPEPLLFDRIHSCALAPDRILVSLREGDLHLLRINADGRTVQRIGISRLGRSAYASCMCSMGSSHFFIGSALGDSVLVRFRERDAPDLEDAPRPMPPLAVDLARDEQQGGAAQALANADATDTGQADEAWDDLYGGAAGGAASPDPELLPDATDAAPAPAAPHATGLPGLPGLSTLPGLQQPASSLDAMMTNADPLFLAAMAPAAPADKPEPTAGASSTDAPAGAGGAANQDAPPAEPDAMDEDDLYGGVVPKTEAAAPAPAAAAAPDVPDATDAPDDEMADVFGTSAGAAAQDPAADVRIKQEPEATPPGAKRKREEEDAGDAAPAPAQPDPAPAAPAQSDPAPAQDPTHDDATLLFGAPIPMEEPDFGYTVNPDNEGDGQTDANQDEEDAMFVYGAPDQKFAAAADQDQGNTQEYVFVVQDTLLNLGPIADFSTGDGLSSVNADVEAAKRKLRNLDLITASGYGRAGSLCRVQSGIRPEIVTQFEIPGCERAWTTVQRAAAAPPADDPFARAHSYLTLSLESSSVALSTGEEIHEVDNLPLISEVQTLATGSVLDDRCMVHVSRRGFQLYQGHTVVQTEEFSEIEVETASIRDPFLLVKLKDMSVVVYELTVAKEADEDGVEEEMIEMVPVDIDLSTPPVLAASLGEATIDGKIEIVCLAFRTTGFLEMLTLPDCALVFCTSHLVDMPATLPDLSTFSAEDLRSDRYQMQSEHYATEMLLHANDPRTAPYLMVVLSSGEVVVYRANGEHHTLSRKRGTINFVKQWTTYVGPFRFADDDDDTGMMGTRIGPMVPFRDIGGRMGYFLCGPRPTWLFEERDALRVHPMHCYGTVVSFADFHNVNCPRGFVCVTDRGAVNICLLPRACIVDAAMPLQKFKIQSTPSHVAYHPPTKSFVVSVVTFVETPVEPDPDTEDPEDMAKGNSGPRVLPTRLKAVHSLRVFPAYDLAKSSDEYELNDIEYVTNVKLLYLRDTSDPNSEARPCVAVSVANMQSEDTFCRGRVLVFEIASQMIDEQHSRPWFKLLGETPIKGPATAVTDCHGMIMVGISNKIIMYNLRGRKTFVGVAFIDVPFYITSLTTLGNYILVTDYCKGTILIRWREFGKQLIIMGRDMSNFDAYQADFVTSGDAMDVITADGRGNFQVLVYLPYDWDHFAGEKLACQADFHLGTNVTRFQRLRLRDVASKTAPDDEKRPRRRGLTYSTQNGSIGIVLPVEEAVFKRLIALQHCMAVLVPLACGANHQYFRGRRTHRKQPMAVRKHVLDLDLVGQYKNLNRETQSNLAQTIGSQRTLVLENLLQLEMSATWY